MLFLLNQCSSSNHLLHYFHVGGNIVIPPWVKEVHHEVELSIVIGKRGKNIPESEALSYIKWWLVMLDMTARYPLLTYVSLV